MRRMRNLAAGVLVCLLVQACAQTQYVETSRAGKQTSDPAVEAVLPMVARQVDYGSSKSLYQYAPRCIMVMPVTAMANSEKGQVQSVGTTRANRADQWRMGDAVARAVARHLNDKVDRVIPASDVALAARRLGLMEDNEARLARYFRCSSAMRIQSQGLEKLYALVWANARLDISLMLVDAKSGDPLWWGSHAANRNGGGPPMGLLSLPFDAFEAGNLANDPELLPSMADDAARRVLASLPNLKGPITRPVLAPEEPGGDVRGKQASPHVQERPKLTGRDLFNQLKTADIGKKTTSSNLPANSPAYR